MPCTIIETEKITNLRLAGDTGFELKHGMGIRNDWPVFSRIIEKTLAAITEEEHQQIYRRWVKLHTRSVFQTRTFWYSVLGTAAVVLLIMGTVVTWNIQLKRQVNQRTEALRRNEIGLEACWRSMSSPRFHPGYRRICLPADAGTDPKPLWIPVISEPGRDHPCAGFLKP